MADAPNILMILTDHWRGDCLGRLGHAAVETPHLDSISRHGVTFARGYTPSPSCVPARRCLNTGMTPDSCGMVGYADGHPWPYRHTLATELRDHGYQTINVGKTHFHPRRLHLGYQMEEAWFTSQAMACIEKRDPTRPWFLTLSFNGPHPPWAVPEHYFNQFMDMDLPAPVQADWSEHHATDADYPLDSNSWRGRVSTSRNHRARAAFFAYLAYIDAQVGRIWDWLSRRGEMHNTMLVFTSDHGEMLGDHNLWRKTYAYEASARVPFIVTPPRSWPDAQRNVVSDALVGWEDIMPTFLDAAERPIPDTVDGRSLRPLLHGDSDGWRDWYHHEHSPCYAADNAYQCLTSVNWKYIWNPITGNEQLFNVSADPDEVHELSADPAHADTLAHWRSTLTAHLADRVEGWSDGATLTPKPYNTYRPPRPEVCTP
jgi:arylsulfatase A-like enzyme